jgi:hypothetical protein
VTSTITAARSTRTPGFGPRPGAIRSTPPTPSSANLPAPAHPVRPGRHRRAISSFATDSAASSTPRPAPPPDGLTRRSSITSNASRCSAVNPGHGHPLVWLDSA